jgi:mannose/cellobiose epimerase-like protein (N-acyl-D-glucosamine 2-epimerase family)
VAQLDQANAYMLLMTPDLPEPEQKQWKAELAGIARTIRSRFYDSGSKMFAGMIPAKPTACVFDREDTDFGHSIKTYWMLYLTGRLTGDKPLETFARDGATGIFQRAFQPATGSWAVKPTCDGKTDTTVSWWMAAELDQAALTFGLVNPEVLRPIPATFDFWLKHMVDHRFGEVWDEIAVPGFAPKQRPKIHLWKNGFHTAEHALVGYLGTSAARAEPVTLYYAFPQCKMPASVRPYYYGGTVTAHQETPLDDMPGFCTAKVTFTNVH